MCTHSIGSCSAWLYEKEIQKTHGGQRCFGLQSPVAHRWAEGAKNQCVRTDLIGKEWNIYEINKPHSVVRSSPFSKPVIGNISLQSAFLHEENAIASKVRFAVMGAKNNIVTGEDRL